MKFAFVLLMSCCLSLSSQCEYEHVQYDNTTKQLYLKTAPITLDLYETPFSARLLLASLIRNGNQFFIEIEITKDSSAQELEALCFKEGARLSFSLKNNAVISISQKESEICGVKQINEDTGFTSVSNYARFILNQKAFDALSQSEVVMIKISDTAYSKTYVLKSELEVSNQDGIIHTNPSRFFIDHISCLTHPKFN